MTNFPADLANDDIFKHLSVRNRQDLAKLAVRKRYRKGEIICFQGDLWRHALYIISGKLNWVMLAPDGKRQVVLRPKAGEVVWGHSLFEDAPMPASLEVVDDCEVYLWYSNDLLPITSHNVDTVWAVTRHLVQTIRQAHDFIYGFAFHPVSGRLARLLLTYYDPAEGETTLRDLTLGEIAHSVGSTRELVSKTLHQFAAQGMIDINRVEIVFKDPAKLSEMMHD